LPLATVHTRARGVRPVIDQNSGSWQAVRHHFRFWRWLSFDPPMRDPGSRGCRNRAVSCQTCSRDLGTTDDPVDGFLLAWRHRRAVRRNQSA
jgi:hypothetical protein